MNKLFAITLSAILFLSACAPSANDVQTAIAATQAQWTATPPPTNTSVPTNPPIPTDVQTDTPIAPVTFTYEGITVDCSCVNCWCATASDVTFIVTLTIDSQGNVTGYFFQYIPQIPDIPLTGKMDSFSGSYQDETSQAEYVGNLSKDMKYINAILSFNGVDENGIDYSGKRVFYFERK